MVVNLGAEEFDPDGPGFSLMRGGGNGIGGLRLQPNNDVLLQADHNLRLEALGGDVRGIVYLPSQVGIGFTPTRRRTATLIYR